MPRVSVVVSVVGKARGRTNRQKPSKYWWAREDSNLQPDRYERSALTIELQARLKRQRHRQSISDRARQRARPLHPQQPLGVAAQYLFLVLVAQRHGFHPI